MTNEREILKLVRYDYGDFGIFADGELVERFKANVDNYQAIIPIKLWRTFNKVLEKRVNELKDRSETSL